MKIAFTAVETENAQCALKELVERYGDVSLEEAEVLVCLGGDGFMLETLHHHLRCDIPVFGMNYGTVGFLMNQVEDPEGKDLMDRLREAQQTMITPLHMEVLTTDGERKEGLGFNDVFIYRQTRQTVCLSIEIDEKMRLPELRCDGIVMSTPAGSTAYNRSTDGPIIPLGVELLSLMPICPFHPRHWRGALLPEEVVARFKLSDTDKRPASAVAGPTEIHNVKEVVVRAEPSRRVTLLFDPHHSLSERIIAEQFSG